MAMEMPCAKKEPAMYRGGNLRLRVAPEPKNKITQV